MEDDFRNRKRSEYGEMGVVGKAEVHGIKGIEKRARCKTNCSVPFLGGANTNYEIFSPRPNGKWPTEKQKAPHR